MQQPFEKIKNQMTVKVRPSFSFIVDDSKIVVTLNNRSLVNDVAHLLRISARSVHLTCVYVRNYLRLSYDLIHIKDFLCSDNIK